jgi:hypothetical protein
MMRVYVHAACPDTSCVSMSILYMYVYVHAGMSSCCMSISMLYVHFHAVCPCSCCMFMSMLHAQCMLRVISSGYLGEFVWRNKSSLSCRFGEISLKFRRIKSLLHHFISGGVLSRNRFAFNFALLALNVPFYCNLNFSFLFPSFSFSLRFLFFCLFVLFSQGDI